MKKKVFALFAFLFLAIGAIAVAAEVNPEVAAALENVAPGEVGQAVSSFVQEFVAKKGIDPQEINEVKQVDFNALPKEVNIENVNDANLAIYEVGYTDQQQDKKVYVITYSVEQLRSQGDLIIAQDKRNFLDFGYSGVMSDSGFLHTSAGVETSQYKGYVMPRDGSITALSTNLEVVQSNSGLVEIVILVNGEPASFGNTISTDSIGIKKDYDVQSRGVVEFSAGDVISVHVQETGDVAWRDVITILEITTGD